MECPIDGEHCVPALPDPFQDSDLFFISLLSMGDSGDIKSFEPPTSSGCRCGNRESCQDRTGLTQAVSKCNSEENKCMCGNAEACTGPTPWCITDPVDRLSHTCMCSVHESDFVPGNGTVKGSCSRQNEKCMEDGKCRGNKTYPLKCDLYYGICFL